MLEEGDAAHVAGRVPGVGGLIVIFQQLAEVRRQQLLVVALDRGVEARGDEGGRVAEEVDVLVHLLDHFQRKLGDQGPVGDEEDRDFLVAVTDPADDVERGALFKRRVAFKVPVEQHGGVGGIGGDEREPVLGRRRAHDLVALIADRVDQTLHGAVGDGIRPAHLTRNQQHPPLIAQPVHSPRKHLTLAHLR